MKVKSKVTDTIYEVFNIRDSNGYPYFLIYEDNQWLYKNAKLFRPVENEEAI